MADARTTALTADASPTVDDLVMTVNDPAGTPVNRKVTIGDLLGALLLKMQALSAQSPPADADLAIIVHDPSGTPSLKKVTLLDLAALSPVRKIAVTLTNAQIKALPTTPITIVPAPGASKRLVLIHADLSIDTTAGAYTNVDTVSAWLTILHASAELSSAAYLVNLDATTPDMTKLSDFLTNAQRTHATLPPYTEAIDIAQTNQYGNAAVAEVFTSSSENSALRLVGQNNGAGDWTGGHAANTLTVTVLYSVVP